MRRLVAINVTKRFAVREDDSVVPVTHLFDAFGEETEDDEAAVTVVAGDERCWFAEHLANFQSEAVN